MGGASPPAEPVGKRISVFPDAEIGEATLREDDTELDTLIGDADEATGRQRTSGDDNISRLDNELEENTRGQRMATTPSKSKSSEPGDRVSVSPLYAFTLVCAHGLSASLLLVVNKWAFQMFPFVWVLTTLQFLPTAIIVWVAGRIGFVEVDSLDLRRLIKFIPAAGMFFITLTAGNAVVKSANVDTFIVMRSLVPIPCAFLETIALGEPCPTPIAWASLCIVVLGAIFYASANMGIAVRSSAWIVLFLTMMPLDAVLIKHVINTSGVKSTWSLVLYQNSIAGALGALGTLTLEMRSLSAIAMAFTDIWSGTGTGTFWPLLLSIVLGVAVSFLQMSVRKVVSSTAFMVLGVANKMLAVLLNQLFMEANGNIVSVSSVFVSILGAVCFQQSVKGKGISQATPEAQKENSVHAVSSSGKPFIAMLVGLVWAGILTGQQQEG